MVTYVRPIFPSAVGRLFRTRNKRAGHFTDTTPSRPPRDCKNAENPCAQFSEEDCGPTLLARGADPPAIRHVYSTTAAFFCLLARIHHPQEPDTLVAQFRRENCCLYGIFVVLDFIVMILAVIGIF